MMRLRRVVQPDRLVPDSRRRFRSGAVAALTAAVVVACGGSTDVGEAAEQLIEATLADDIALGSLDATCIAPEEQEQGATFTCSATTETGGVITFDGVMTSDDRFDVRSNNLLTSEDVDNLIPIVVDSINETIEGAQAVPEDVTCADGSVILDDGAFVCEITNTADGTRFPIEIDTGGLVGGEPADLSWEIGEPIE